MEILLETYKKYQEDVIASIKKRSRLRPDIKRIGEYKDTDGAYYVVIHHNKLRVSDTEHKRMTESLSKIEHVQRVMIIQTVPRDFQKNYKYRDCRFIFDIDSTLTRGHPGIMAKESKLILDLLKSKEHWLHFATGRSDSDLHDIIRYFETEPQGIAENGGLIILGETKTIHFGHRIEPDKAFQCLRARYKGRVRQDIQQGSRMTERIITNSLSKPEYEKCTKRYKVDVLASKSSYHIVEKGINKGTALRKLIHERRWNDDYIVCVGDSDLDVPLFKEADVSFAVGNSSELAKKRASDVLANNFEQGVKEMLEFWFD